MLLIGAGLIIPAYILLDIDQYLRIITRNRVSNAHVYGVASFVGIRLSLVACVQCTGCAPLAPFSLVPRPSRAGGSGNETKSPQDSLYLFGTRDNEPRPQHVT